MALNLLTRRKHLRHKDNDLDRVNVQLTVDLYEGRVAMSEGKVPDVVRFAIHIGNVLQEKTVLMQEKYVHDDRGNARSDLIKDALEDFEAHVVDQTVKGYQVEA